MSRKKSFIRLAVLLAGVVGVFTFCFQARSQNLTQSITFAWDPSSDTNVVGYLIDYGTASGEYTAEMDVGTNTSATITNLAEGMTYYFVVVAYSAQALQSAPSGEVSVTMPGQLYISQDGNPGDPVQIIFPTAPGHWYELQASSASGPGASWTTIWQTPVATDFLLQEYDDPVDPSVPSRFYRLVLH